MSIQGTTSADLITNTVIGTADTIYGYAGADTLIGSNDTLYGGADGDVLVGYGAALVLGEDGDDTLRFAHDTCIQLALEQSYQEPYTLLCVLCFYARPEVFLVV